MEKSVFDGMPVNDKAFPLSDKADKGSFFPARDRTETLGIVGNCRWCNAPIYGKRTVRSDETPLVKYSCSCLALDSCKGKQFTDTIHTK